MRSLVGLIIATLVVIGCGTTSTGPCAPIAPRQLPDGSAPGELATGGAPGDPLWSWTGGPWLIMQTAGRAGADAWPSCAPGEILALGACRPPAEVHAASTVVRGQPAFAFFAGDGVAVGLSLTWNEAGCTYLTSVGPGLTLPQVVEYAAHY